MTVQYDPSRLNFLRTMRKWKGTAFPLVVYQPVFWGFVIIHITCTVLFRIVKNHEGEYLTNSLPNVSYSLVNSITALLIFFLVFYGSQCYQRLQMFYTQCVGLSGSSMNWIALVKVKISDDENVKWNCVRMVLAANHMLYYSLNADHGGPPLNDEEWEVILTRRLLSPHEKEVISSYGGQKYFMLLVWAMQEVEAAIARDATDATDARTADLLNSFREEAFKFRGHCGQITNWLIQPVPFPYFHLIQLFMLFNLFLYSYTLVSDETMAGALGCFIYCVYVLMLFGLKEVAVAMSDPFGDDDIDFDLEPMLAGSYNNAIASLRDVRAPLVGLLPPDWHNPISDRDTLPESVYHARPKPVPKKEGLEWAFEAALPGALSTMGLTKENSRRNSFREDSLRSDSRRANDSSHRGSATRRGSKEESKLPMRTAADQKPGDFPLPLEMPNQAAGGMPKKAAGGGGVAAKPVDVNMVEPAVAMMDTMELGLVGRAQGGGAAGAAAAAAAAAGAGAGAGLAAARNKEVTIVVQPEGGTRNTEGRSTMNETSEHSADYHKSASRRRRTANVKTRATTEEGPGMVEPEADHEANLLHGGGEGEEGGVDTAAFASRYL